MIRLKRILRFGLVTGLLCSPGFALQGPDVTVSQVVTSNNFNYYGQSGGIAAYSFATTSCNIGNQVLLWGGSASLNHPVIGQNIFRLKDGRFEQLGQSWLKHGFCAVNENSCGSCQGTPCSTLGIGCADTYSASLNDGAGGGPKWAVNSSTGSHTHLGGSPSGPTAIRGRLQVPVNDVEPTLNVGARYFAESQYVTADDSQAGNHKNNIGWKEITFASGVNNPNQVNNVTFAGQSALRAWKAADPQVTLVEIQVPNEGGAGVHGWYFLGYRVTDNGDGTWTYTYSLQNMTSDSGVRSFRLPLSSDVSLSSTMFRGVPYHSGDIYSNADWAFSETGSDFGWASTQTHAQNVNANALRWGTMYTFTFTATSGPIGGVAEMERFKPGAPALLTAPVLVPDVATPTVGTAFCFGDGTGTFCPCFNFGDAGHGCGNQSFSSGARLQAFGSASVTSDDLVLSATGSRINQAGLFYQGLNQVNGGLGVVFGDGLRCVGVDQIRIQSVLTDGSGNAATSVSVSTEGGVSAGMTRNYQWWYRDSGASPCGMLSNLSNGLEIVWIP